MVKWPYFRAPQTVPQLINRPAMWCVWGDLVPSRAIVLLVRLYWMSSI